MTIEPSQIYPPNTPYESIDDTPPTYDTYNTHTIGGPGPQRIRDKIYAPPAKRQTNVPEGVPKFLGNKNVIFNTWVVAMIVISFDEWHNLHIFPRPLRLWYASELFGVLYLFSIIDAFVPLANAFAIGYLLVLIYQYYNGGITPGTGSSGPHATTQQEQSAGVIRPTGSPTITGNGLWRTGKPSYSKLVQCLSLC